jgi:hypothetical protein
MTYLTREQLQVIENLGGDRNARRILLEMEKKKLINSVRYDKKIYYISNKGSDRIGKGGVNLKRSWIQHTLMRNDLFIFLGQPSDWKKEVPIYNGEEVYLIPDAIFKKNGVIYFVEIDNTQTMKINIEKIKKYKELFPTLKHTPILIWYSLSPIRKEKLSAACVKAGIKFKIY